MPLRNMHAAARRAVVDYSDGSLTTIAKTKSHYHSHLPEDYESSYELVGSFDEGLNRVLQYMIFKRQHWLFRP